MLCKVIPQNRLLRRGIKCSLAVEVAKSFIGTWYKWGGDDPSGFDCSGFVCEILKSVGLIERKTDFMACGLLFKFFDNCVFAPGRGCLVFYGRRAEEHDVSSRTIMGINVKYYISHVEFALDAEHSIGASGGGRNTRTEVDAIRDNAFIKVRPIDRPGLLFAVDPFKSLE